MLGRVTLVVEIHEAVRAPELFYVIIRHPADLRATTMEGPWLVGDFRPGWYGDQMRVCR